VADNCVTIESGFGQVGGERDVEASECVNRFLFVGIVVDCAWIIVADNCFVIESDLSVCVPKRGMREILKGARE